MSRACIESVKEDVISQTFNVKLILLIFKQI